MVAHAPDGKWLYLFHPELIKDRSDGDVDTNELIQPGVLHSERLVKWNSRIISSIVIGKSGWHKTAVQRARFLPDGLLKVGHRIPQHVANPILHHVANGFRSG